ncbi:MAG: XkdX family protein [Oscillospiraceae bacterium]|nr:XkdX family protein [Oscillospiraceae bacterium]
MTTFELAKQYYPRLWNRERIEALAAAGRLTAAEAKEILEGK